MGPRGPWLVYPEPLTGILKIQLASQTRNLRPAGQLAGRWASCSIPCGSRQQPPKTTWGLDTAPQPGFKWAGNTFLRIAQTCKRFHGHPPPTTSHLGPASISHPDTWLYSAGLAGTPYPKPVAGPPAPTHTFPTQPPRGTTRAADATLLCPFKFHHLSSTTQASLVTVTDGGEKDQETWGPKQRGDPAGGSPFLCPGPSRPRQSRQDPGWVSGRGRKCTKAALPRFSQPPSHFNVLSLGWDLPPIK